MSFSKKVFGLLVIIALCINILGVVNFEKPVQAAMTWTARTFTTDDSRIVQGDPCVIYDAATGKYKMWYTQNSGSAADLNTVISDLVTESNSLATRIKNQDFSGPVTSSDREGFKDVLNYLANTSSANIVTLIQGPNSSIAYAESPDGINWTTVSAASFSGSPTDNWDDFGVSSPWVIKNSSGNYEMWYNYVTVNAASVQTLFADIKSKVDGLTDPQIDTLITDLFIDKDLAAFINDFKTYVYDADNGILNRIKDDISDILTANQPRIGYATSSDGRTWNNFAQITIGGSGIWDQVGALSPSVVKITNNSYEMWYTGLNVGLDAFFDLLHTGISKTELLTALSDSIEVTIGKAISPDGTTWLKQNDNGDVLGANLVGNGDTNIEGLAFPSVIRNTNGSYDMWYTKFSYSCNSLVDLLLGGTLTDALNGLDTGIYHAASTASQGGQNWTADASAVMTLADTGNPKVIGAPAVVRNGNRYLAYYSYGNVTNTGSFISDVIDHSLSTALANSNAKVGVGVKEYNVPYVPPATNPSGTVAGGNQVDTGDLELEGNLVVDAGGVVQSPVTIHTGDGNLSIEIEAGLVMKDSQGNPLSEISCAPTVGIPPAPPENTLVLSYDFGPPGATFNPPLQMTIDYDNLLVPADEEDTIFVAYWNGLQWLTVPCVVNTETNQVTFSISHFSTYSLMYGPALPPEGATSTPTATTTVTPTQPTQPTQPTTTVSTTSPTGTTTTTGEPGPGGTPVWVWIILGVVVVLAVVAVVVMIIRRRNS